jgi:hypothetical protein
LHRVCHSLVLESNGGTFRAASMREHDVLARKADRRRRQGCV